jgi:hypothetical protein
MLRLSVIFVIVCLLFGSCRKIVSVGSPELHFSDDTLQFDTVFASVGSVTRELRIINPGRNPFVINHLYLGGGQSSPYRLNIDGEPVSEKSDLEIESGDSIFIFVELFVDPGNSNSPVLVNDSILFNLGEKSQRVILSGWGQDINLIKNKTIGTSTWIRGKPYVIYDKLVVDTLGTLTVEAGTRILFHRNASLVIAGTLIVNGSVSSPVFFAGDRLEEMYGEIPGQWKGILFLNTAKGNIISHGIIKNSIFGIQVGEPGAVSDFPALKLFSTVIAHTSVSGLSAIKGNIEAANCAIYHCGRFCVHLEAGGEYTFTNCSIFNQWEYGVRLTPALFVTEKPENPGSGASQMDVTLNNSVIYGANDSELDIVPLNTIFTGNYFFDHCLIRLDTSKAKFMDSDEFPKVIFNKDPLFIDAGKWDLRPDSLSPLINNGDKSFSVLYPFDIRGVSRTPGVNPDIGAFERLPGENKKEKGN